MEKCGQRSRLDVGIGHADAVDHSPLDGQGRQALRPPRLGQQVLTGVGIAVVGLACKAQGQHISHAAFVGVTVQPS